MSSLSESITSLKTMLQNAEKEIKLLESGRKSSAPRARKSLQNIKTTSHILRKSIMEHMRKIPVKSRVKKENDMEVKNEEEEDKMKREVNEKPKRRTKLVKKLNNKL